MSVIKIDKGQVLCDDEDIKGYLDVLNGIAYDCWHNHGFEQGWRNTIAVDLTVAAYELGLDPKKVLDEMVKENVICLFDDDEDTYVRISTVMDYKGRFSWSWMIDPDIYQGIGEEHTFDERMPVRFELR